MKAEIVILAVLLVSIALTLSACTPQKIAEVDVHTKDMLITYTTPQQEPPQMINTFTQAEKTEIINPYFSLQNTTDEIFRVDHEGNFYLYPLLSCDTLDTDETGLLSCGTDADTNLTEDNVEAYIFDDDNTADLTTAGNITVEGITASENATINGLHIDAVNSTHWKLWG